MRTLLAGLIAVLVLSPGLHAQKPRENDLKLPIGGTPGPLDAITDVAGVEVGHATLISGSGKLVVGKGPVRTGVTVVHPRGKANPDPVFAAWFTLNGNGEMTGTTWVQESGLLEGPVAITNTHSVGVVRDAIIKWEVSQKNALQPWWLPVVAETYDGDLNDINGFHVKPEHVLAALDGATGGLPKEGVVGGGTGMICLGFKGGIGTASRTLPAEQGGYTVGVLVQCNFGARRDLRIAGVPVGEEIPDLPPCIANNEPLPPNSPRRRCDAAGATRARRRRRSKARSSSSSRPTRRSCRISSSASRRACRSASAGRADSAATARATSSSRSPPRTRARGSTTAGDARPDAAERSDHAAVPGDRAGDRSGDHQRAARRGDDDRRERSARLRHAGGPDARRDAEVRTSPVAGPKHAARHRRIALGADRTGARPVDVPDTW